MWEVRKISIELRLKYNRSRHKFLRNHSIKNRTALVIATATWTTREVVHLFNQACRDSTKRKKQMSFAMKKKGPEQISMTTSSSYLAKRWPPTKLSRQCDGKPVPATHRRRSSQKGTIMWISAWITYTKGLISLPCLVASQNSLRWKEDVPTARRAS